MKGYVVKAIDNYNGVTRYYGRTLTLSGSSFNDFYEDLENYFKTLNGAKKLMAGMNESWTGYSFKLCGVEKDGNNFNYVELDI